MVRVHDLFDEQAALTPEVVAVVSWSTDRKVLSYPEVCQRSVQLAAGLERWVWKKLAEDHSITKRDFVIAILLSRTHIDFVPLLLAASRCGLPFVLLSNDLPDKDLQRERNALVFRLLHPHLCIRDPSLSDAAIVDSLAAACIDIGELAGALPWQEPSKTAAATQSSNVFSFMFTGGSFRTKVVEVTHEMVVHERARYSELWTPRLSPAVVLGHTSVYWGASALGQLDIALAYGGTIVWTEATEVAELRRCIVEEGVTVLGVVPDHLDLLAPTAPAQELPHIEVVFTWGERLPRRTAERWLDHPRAILRELLIATEYWLSLWADPLGSGVLQIVGGTNVLVLKEDGEDAALDEVGELCISGPMVMAGYRDLKLPGVVALEDVFYTTSAGDRFFRTRDLVRRVPNGLVYKGRADMMAKDKGKWVDMLAVEDQVAQIPGVRAAKILPDPAQEHFHAFVALDHGIPPGRALDLIWSALPSRSQVWQLPDLPRHPVTRKVDSARLLRMLAGVYPSWPMQGYSKAEATPTLLKARLADTIFRQFTWSLAVLGMAWAIADESDVLTQLALGAAFWFGASCVLRHAGEATICAFTSLWLASILIVQSPGWMRCARGFASLLLASYWFHALIYIDDARSTSLIAGVIMAFIDQIPFWKVGAFFILGLSQHLPGPWGSGPFGILVAISMFGAVKAWWRRRVFAWPVALWWLGGQQLEKECGNWIYFAAWTGSFKWKAGAVLESVASVRKRLFIKTSVPSLTQPEITPTVSRAYLSSCVSCGVGCNDSHSSARDNSRQLLCTPCGSTFADSVEAAAVVWLSDHINEFPFISKRESDFNDCGREPPAKRLRRDCNKLNGNGVACVTVAGCSSEIDIHSDEWIQKRKGLTRWWWYNHVLDTLDIVDDYEKWLQTAATNAVPVSHEDIPLEARAICSVVAEIEPFLKPVHLGTVLLGLDSLRIARLSNAIRVQLGRALSAPQLRAISTVRELVDVVASAEEAQMLKTGNVGPAVDDTCREYAVWYSPGQYTPMGSWILRLEAPVDQAAMVQATQQLVERHVALRAEAADPLRYNAFMFDAATLFALYAPIWDAGPLLLRLLRRLLSWACVNTWPRVRCKTRNEIYATRFPGIAAPFTSLRVTNGQCELERMIKHQKNNLVPPAEITTYELVCELEDSWACDHWDGRFVILRSFGHIAGTADLVYVDQSSGEWGPLLGPDSPQWSTAPYGFPALFFVPMNTGAVAWLRLEKKDEIRLLYQPGGTRGKKMYHVKAFRQAPQRDLSNRKPVVVSYLGICMCHAFADGNCYLPLVQDLFALYKAAAGEGPPPHLPMVDCAFEKLEKRLFDTFRCTPSPMRSSLRGSIFKYNGRGYGHSLGLGVDTVRALTRVLASYRVPLDVGLLGLVAIAVARADKTDLVEFTLYTPQRDGASESLLVGLFSDWRDLALSVDFELSTVLGTVLQVNHKVHHRQWAVFNALKKPEAMVVNIQPLDFEKHAGFVHLGENMWRDGDRIGIPEKRIDDLPYVHQKANFVIEQQDQDTWWVLVSAGYDKRPTPWLRHFLYAFDEAVRSLLLDPTALVHRPAPDDDLLLYNFELRMKASAGDLYDLVQPRPS